MPIFECPILLHSDNVKSLKDSILAKSYIVKNMDVLFDPETEKRDINKYVISIKVPLGKAHYNNLIKAFEQVGATKAEDEWGTAISESKWENIFDFLREKGPETIGIYIGSFILIISIIFYLNLLFPRDHDDGEITHLILKTTAWEWVFFGLDAIIPSFVYLVTSWNKYKRRYHEPDTVTK